MVIEKREGGYVDVLDFIEPDYRAEIANLVEAMFSHWGVTRLTVEKDEEGYWRATAELAYEAVEVTENHPAAALMRLFPYLMLCKVAQSLCQ
jgi:hypothetical protein